MKLIITINMDNAAFGELPDDKCAEVARILQETLTGMPLARVYYGEPGSGPLRDSNGNTVGSWKVTGK